MRDLHIVHFLNYCRDGGTVDMVLSLMTRSKYRHTYLTFNASVRRREQFEKIGLELVELGTEDIDPAVAYVKENASLLHCQQSGGPEPGVSIGLQAGKPVIETCQSPSLPAGKTQGAIPVVVSRGILEYWPCELQDTRVIYSSAEPIPLLDKFVAKQHFGLDPNRPVVGRLGRLEGIKRPQDFLSAVPTIAAMHPEAQFLLVGDGTDGTGIRNMATNMINLTGMSIEIRMPGFLQGDEKALAYNAMDVFLYPTSMEGFGIVFAEAMSVGLPIVTYSDPVNVDVVGSAGLYCTDNIFRQVTFPWTAMAHLVVDLLENRREYDKLSKWGMQRYKDHYTPERMAAEYDDLYEEMT